jgi:nicotinamidase/pyrazinamidase
MDRSSHRALIIVDVQNDFCPGGALEVSRGDEVVPAINRLSAAFDKTVATQDWHPAAHFSFASHHPGKKPMDIIEIGRDRQVLWPDHCVQGTRGAEFHPELDTSPISLIVRKGTNPSIDSYSGFFDNDKKTSTGLEHYLKGLGYREVFLCGLAIDYCVYYTAMDAVRLGFETYLIEDACRGVGFPEGSIERSLDDMRARGVKVLTSGDMK